MLGIDGAVDGGRVIDDAIVGRSPGTRGWVGTAWSGPSHGMANDMCPVVTELGVVVEAPADDAALAVDDEGVVRAARDLVRLGTAGQRADAGREEGGEVVALEEPARELGLLASAPGKDLVLFVKGEDMV